MRAVSAARRSSSFAAAMIVACALARSAHADAPPTPDPHARARAAYEMGTKLADQGQWVEALAQFELAVSLRPHAVHRYGVALCQRALGRYTQARKSFSAALSAGDLPAELATEGRAYLAQIEVRLARALVTSSPAGSTLAVDGAPLEVGVAEGGHVELVAGTRDPGPGEAVPSSAFQVVLNPGSHVLVVSAPGAPDVVVTRVFASGTTVPLVLGAPATVVTAPPPSSMTRRRAGAGAAFTMAGVGLGALAVFGGLALARKSDLLDECMSRCPARAQSTIDAMNGFANASTIGAVVAVVGAATGAALWITGAPTTDKPAPSTALLLKPAVVGFLTLF
jgi:hypothetical protein